MGSICWNPRIHAHFMEAASYISRYEEMDTETRQHISSAASKTSV